MTVHVLLNPAASGGRTRARRPALDRALAAAGLDAAVTETRDAAHARALAADVGRAGGLAVAAGGDGTVHAVANGLAGTGGTLGVLPLGTGNDLARALGMSPGLDAAVRALARAPARRMDLGRVAWTDDDGDHERRFANALGLGFDAAVAAHVGRFKWMGSRPAYLAAVVQALWAARRPGPPVHVVAPEAGLDQRGPLLLCVVGNGPTAGGGFVLTPGARLDDGWLDVCLARHVPVRRAVRLLPGTFAGAHVGAPEVTTARVRSLSIAASGPVALQADGEVLSASARRVWVAVEPGALAVRAPGPLAA